MATKVIDVSLILKVFSCMVIIFLFVVCGVGYSRCDGARLNFDGNMNHHNARFEMAIVCTVLIAFGILALLGEFEARYVEIHASFLCKRIGRGIYYLVLGFVTLGVTGDLGMVGGILLMINGLFHIIYGAAFGG
ncbi:golgi apparatus membrane protein tvp15 [Anaeramoeba flamelloides]|uniref:Golgi apparatus membrane protein tvp15 n=1 Tax=Anaeramoeba flamelloides TaxID=1746091 RepID=A0AAV7Y4E5_9EUKA|nr:golgi apparatus membrane protein tvp15 [Anaeramoeba flamelloides]|eukprot:Anaeramoba_flamelloidesc34129_g1_i1.p1 GENE.c34129_g1_i1~~c34129_g1_i1.p1  ORF type:complete len:134 (-),score=11.32 c34129_g1_i1:121-522(-)